MKKLYRLFALGMLLLVAVPAFATPVRVYVTDMSAVGVANKDEMKLTLQTLLASRLNGDGVLSVGSAAEADVLVSGTYVSIGKIFSVDALAKTIAGRTLARSFIQGDSQDELIPAIGKLADKLSVELQRAFDHTAGADVSQASPVSTVKRDIIRAKPVAVTAATGSDIIKAQSIEQGATSGWISKRLEGASNLLAVGTKQADGSRDLILAMDQKLQYFRQGPELKLIAEAALSDADKIIALDILDASTNGSQEIYVTVIRNGDLSSQVWEIKGDKLVQIARDLPYHFRVIALAGGPKKLYAQGMGRDADYFGDVFEATRNGKSIVLKNPIKMPRYGNIHSFNQFRDAEGKLMTVAISTDNYLVVYDSALKELWRSNDKFGGSELYFQKEDLDLARVTGDRYRWFFLNQKIQVTAKQEVLVGKNDGFWIMGNARSYKRGSVYCLAWNNSSLEEKWRTKDTQNYMPDYWYDEQSSELLMLQIAQRPGITEKGASALAIKKVE